jgi:hypothetical protein
VVAFFISRTGSAFLFSPQVLFDNYPITKNNLKSFLKLDFSFFKKFRKYCKELLWDRSN